MTRATQLEPVNIGFREGVLFGWRLFRMMRPYWWPQFKNVGVVVAVGLLGLVAPFFSKTYFDRALPAHDVHLSAVLVIATCVAGVTAGGVGILRGYYGQVVTAQLTTQFGLLFFNHLQRQPLSFFDSGRVGEMASRSSDLQRSLVFVSGVVSNGVVNGVYLVLVPPVLFALNWRLAALSLAAFPVTSLFSVYAGRTIRRHTRENAEFAADSNAFQIEALTNLRLIKSLAAEADVCEEYSRRQIRAQQASLQVASLAARLGLANSIIRTIAGGIYSWYAWRLMIRGELSMGSFVAFTAYLGYLTGPTGRIASAFMSTQQTLVSLYRFFEYYDAPAEPAVVHGPGILAPKRGGGHVAFRGVHFGYGDADVVLPDATFDLHAGRVTIIIGQSGSGKSSILRLMLRLYQPRSGRILLDGIDINALNVASLRTRIGVVWQENATIRGSVRDNLLFGNTLAAPSAIANALDDAALTDVIEALPHGLDTKIAEAGATLSAGQRQRLAIARVLIRRPDVIVFDEATANLDQPTEQRVLRSVIARASGATIILVTHRLQLLDLADHVVSVSGAGLVTEGLGSSTPAVEAHRNLSAQLPPSGEARFTRVHV